MAGGLELDDLYGPFQPKPFCDAMILWQQESKGEKMNFSIWMKSKQNCIRNITIIFFHFVNRKKISCFKNTFHVHVFLLLLPVKIFYAKEQGDVAICIEFCWNLGRTAQLSCPPPVSYQKSLCVALLHDVQSLCWPGWRGSKQSSASRRSPSFQGDSKMQLGQPRPWLFPKLMLMGLLQCCHIKITRQINCSSRGIMYYGRTASSDLLYLKGCQN